MNIVITGASKGMGKAMAEKFAASGHTLFICSRNEDSLKNTADEIKNKFPGSTVNYLAADLSNNDNIKKFTQWILGFGLPLDVLINNAGIFLPGSVYNEPEGTLEQMIDNNLYSAYHVTRALLPVMMTRMQGHIFNMCSIASLNAYANGGSYSISKYALAGFSRNLREEMKPYKIKVTAVYPGAVYTSSWQQSEFPESRFIKSDDIANLVFATSLLSPEACVEDIVIRPIEGDIP